MIRPQSMEELASYVDHKGKTVFFFTADWCGDCRFIKPFLPEIEAENPDFTFVEVDRDQYMPVAQKWDVYGYLVWLLWKMAERLVAMSIVTARPRVKSMIF